MRELGRQLVSLRHEIQSLKEEGEGKSLEASTLREQKKTLEQEMALKAIKSEEDRLELRKMLEEQAREMEKQKAELQTLAKQNESKKRQVVSFKKKIKELEAQTSQNFVEASDVQEENRRLHAAFQELMHKFGFMHEAGQAMFQFNEKEKAGFLAKMDMLRNQMEEYKTASAVHQQKWRDAAENEQKLLQQLQETRDELKKSKSSRKGLINRLEMLSYTKDEAQKQMMSINSELSSELAAAEAEKRGTERQLEKFVEEANKRLEEKDIQLQELARKAQELHSQKISEFSEGVKQLIIQKEIEKEEIQREKETAERERELLARESRQLVALNTSTENHIKILHEGVERFFSRIPKPILSGFDLDLEILLKERDPKKINENLDKLSMAMTEIVTYGKVIEDKYKDIEQENREIAKKIASNTQQVIVYVQSPPVPGAADATISNPALPYHPSTQESQVSAEAAPSNALPSLQEQPQVDQGTPSNALEYHPREKDPDAELLRRVESQVIKRKEKEYAGESGKKREKK